MQSLPDIEVLNRIVEVRDAAERLIVREIE